jgi:hypothetical protein
VLDLQKFNGRAIIFNDDLWGPYEFLEEIFFSFVKWIDWFFPRSLWFVLENRRQRKFALLIILKISFNIFHFVSIVIKVVGFFLLHHLKRNFPLDKNCQRIIEPTLLYNKEIKAHYES